MGRRQTSCARQASSWARRAPSSGVRPGAVARARREETCEGRARAPPAGAPPTTAIASAMTPSTGQGQRTAGVGKRARPGVTAGGVAGAAGMGAAVAVTCGAAPSGAAVATIGTAVAVTTGMALWRPAAAMSEAVAFATARRATRRDLAAGTWGRRRGRATGPDPVWGA